MNKLITYLSIILFCSLMISCEEDPDVIDPAEVDIWKYYNTSNGLTDNLINCIKQDKAGNIWVGTGYGGVDMYDGSKWISYSINDGLLSNCVYAIEEDADGIIWFATSEGLNYLIDEETYFNDSLDDIAIIPSSLYKDSNKQMWIGTFGQGIFIYDRYGFSHFDLENTDYLYINYITEDIKHNIWFATTGGALYYDGEEFYVFDEKQGLNNNNVSYILQDVWGDLWFSSLDGEYLTRYNGIDVELISLFNGKPTSMVYSMVQDLERNIWFTTIGAGIVKYNGVEMQTIKMPDGLKDNNVICSIMDKDGNLWFGTYEAGLNVYIKK